MYKFVFFVPESHVESVKDAIFHVGGGKLGNYSHCSWQVLGIGQFKPLKDSQPYSGEINQLHTVPEWRVELVVEEPLIQAAVNAMKAAHPYEMPAYEVINLEDY
ncbi:NGG1p interacting factor NIF3 [Wohlfahrtiimonas larvae]|uniref:YqfO family protein n=1 Tax=Wohlfahrtiimonas larvae TaxID=1157986 RepID=A0ABP9MQX3_9GAMM|nr:NGG1p interacting factor NIF3 [Wohlfahrtiimonas larvae]